MKDAQAVEMRVFGPPGTGKTTHLAERIKNAAERFGSDKVLVSSFTRAAAREIASRRIPIDHENVGTLHSIMYRALHSPDLTANHIDDWNKANPNYQLSDTRSDVDEPGSERVANNTNGDIFMHQTEILRARMIPQATWPDQVLFFYERWCAWKKSEHLLDFTDLIEIGYQDFSAAPRYPSVGFFDEAQDFTRLQVSLIRKWAHEMDYILLAGDDDQMLYDFTGATPDVMLDPPIPDKLRKVLERSYRVPRAIHRVSEQWIKQLTIREPKVYEPRDEEGSAVFRAGLKYSAPERLVEQVADNISFDGSKSVMILASCSYMLRPVIERLRKVGIPFWNPYRKTRGDWNPLARRKGSVSASERLEAFAVPSAYDPRVWSIEQLNKWIQVLASKGLLKYQAKDLIELYADEKRNTPKDAEEYDALIMSLFETEEALRVLDMLSGSPDLDWFMQHLSNAKKRAFEYPLRILKNSGVKALTEVPRVTVGTIHSVKGGEADIVYLLPELSMAGMREWTKSSAGRDAIIRQFYVGMTRARERLIVCNTDSSYRVSLF